MPDKPLRRAGTVYLKKISPEELVRAMHEFQVSLFDKWRILIMDEITWEHHICKEGTYDA